MTFTSDKLLIYYINKRTAGSKWGVGAFCLFSLFGALAFYYKSSTHSDLILNLLVTFLIAYSVIYSIVVNGGKEINKIIDRITITEKQISISTFSYGIMFYKIKSKEIVIERNSINIKETPFPFNSAGLPNNKTLVIKINEESFYLVYECFPVEVKSQLIS